MKTKRNRKNYTTISSNGGLKLKHVSFHYKKDAITEAKKEHEAHRFAHVLSRRTQQITHVLYPQQCSCSVCGNELEGKQHCPLCGQLHAY